MRNHSITLLISQRAGVTLEKTHTGITLTIPGELPIDISPDDTGEMLYRADDDTDDAQANCESSFYFRDGFESIDELYTSFYGYLTVDCPLPNL